MTGQCWIEPVSILLLNMSFHSNSILAHTSSTFQASGLLSGIIPQICICLSVHTCSVRTATVLFPTDRNPYHVNNVFSLFKLSHFPQRNQYILILNLANQCSIWLHLDNLQEELSIADSSTFDDQRQLQPTSPGFIRLQSMMRPGTWVTAGKTIYVNFIRFSCLSCQHFWLKSIDVITWLFSLLNYLQSIVYRSMRIRNKVQSPQYLILYYKCCWQ